MVGTPAHGPRPARWPRAPQPVLSDDRPSGGALAWLALAGVALGALPGCDNNATFFKITLPFKEIRVISAVPAQDVAGTYEPMCGLASGAATSAPDGFLLGVAFVSNERNDSDRDESLRPGDRVNDRTVQGGKSFDIDLENTSLVNVELSCLEPMSTETAVPDDTLGLGCAQERPDATTKSAGYLPFTASRPLPELVGEGHNVLVLVDESGSTAGLVDTTIGYKEASTGTFSPAGSFKDDASDFTNYRHTAVKTFIGRLNTNDRLGVLAFGQGLPTSEGMVVPCSLAESADTTADLETCFGTNHGLWTDGDPIGKLGAGKTGRSNLWSAVDTAYDFLKVRSGEQVARSNHIIVVTDGPETCDSNSLTFAGCGQSPCGTARFSEVLDKIDADRSTGAFNVQIHFVQFESKGYQGRDPRQMEVSCLTNGHYQYINTEDMPRESTDILDALTTALSNVRFSLQGYWRLAVNVPLLAGTAPLPLGTPAGDLYAFSGTVRVDEDAGLIPTPASTTNLSKLTQQFGVGLGTGASGAQQWDRRPVIRKVCSAPTDCNGSSNDETTCHVVCSQETFLCPGANVGVDRPNQTPCTLDTGITGFCCTGSCQDASDECTACN